MHKSKLMEHGGPSTRCRASLPLTVGVCRIGFKQAELDQRLDRARADDFVGLDAGDDETPADCSSFGNFGFEVGGRRRSRG